MALQAAKSGLDETFLCAYGGVVSAAWPGALYIQSDSRTCGVRVEKASHGLVRGASANIGGIPRTNSDGERYIEVVAYVLVAGTGASQPLGLNNRLLLVRVQDDITPL